MSETTRNEKLLQEAAELQAEVEQAEALYPQLVAFEGPLPTCLEDVENLPEPWQRQYFNKHRDHYNDLVARERLLALAAAADAREARRQELLREINADAEPVPFKNLEEFNNLTPRERQKWASRLSQEQRDALLGIERDTKAAGYF